MKPATNTCNAQKSMENKSLTIHPSIKRHAHTWKQGLRLSKAQAWERFRHYWWWVYFVSSESRWWDCIWHRRSSGRMFVTVKSTEKIITRCVLTLKAAILDFAFNQDRMLFFCTQWQVILKQVRPRGAGPRNVEEDDILGFVLSSCPLVSSMMPVVLSGRQGFTGEEAAGGAVAVSGVQSSVIAVGATAVTPCWL